tara:strand:- start:386 stop:553 length:168 start_codon:yes stop_codon:yes gene_type:complete
MEKNLICGMKCGVWELIFGGVHLEGEEMIVAEGIEVVIEVEIAEINQLLSVASKK